jgi:hypothetical protein
MSDLQSNLPVRITYAPHPFKVERHFDKFDAGNSLQDMLEKIQPVPWLRTRATISIDGNLIDEELWATTIPKSGSLVVIRVLPGGGRKKGGKLRGILGIVVAIAAIAAAAITQQYWAVPLLGFSVASSAAFVGGLAGMAVGIIGNLLINALVPPPKGTVNSGQELAEQSSPTQYIEGSRNQINRWGVIPRLFGFRRIVPLKCAQDFTDIIGNDHYVTCLFALGYADLQISDLKIGETILSAFQGVEIEYRNLTYVNGTTVTVYGNEPHKLYTQDIQEEQFSILLEINKPNIRTVQLGCIAISVDVTFPNGLYTLIEDGWRINHGTSVKIEYREVGETIWTLQENWFITNSVDKTFRVGKKFSVNIDKDPTKQYEVRLTKTGDDAWNQQGTMYWSALRSFKEQNPIDFPERLSTIALRIKATDQLNGTIDEFNCIAKSILLDWDSSAATWTERITNNPASIFRAVLQDAANPRPLADSRIDLTKIQYWHEYCIASSWSYNKVVDTPISIYSLLGEVCASGRAAICEHDSKWSVVLDEEQLLPAQIFTPRNSWDLEVSLNYPDMPHGLRCSFNNEQQDYQKDERFVLDDNYQTDELDAWNHYHPEYPQATIFEQIDLPGITNPNAVFKLGRYHLATARLRPRNISFKCDFEHLAVTRGDLIHVAHDVMLVGLGSGRVKSLILDGSNNLTGVVTDTIFEMVDGTDYCLRFRIPDLTMISLQKQIETISGTFATFTLIDPITDGELSPNIGDLVLFGELDFEMIPAVVKNITTSSDLSAEIVCVDSATAIHRADIGVLPKFTPGITLPPEWKPPIVNSIRSDIGVMIYDGNNWQINIFVLLEHYSRRSYPYAISVECVYNKLDEETKTTLFSNDINEIRIMPVTSSIYYEFKLRYIYNDGNKSKWSDAYTHRVSALTEIPDITNLVSFYNGNKLYIKWDAIVNRQSGYPGIDYEIRKGAVWNTGEIVGVVKDPEFALIGDGSYWVAARVQNSYSPNPTMIEISNSSSFLTNIYIENEEYAGDWTGTFDYTKINDLGYLELSGTGFFDGFTALDSVADLDIEGGIATSGYYTTSSNNIVDLGEAQTCGLLISTNSVTHDLYSTVTDYPDFDGITNFDGDIAQYTSVKPQIAIAATTQFGNWQDYASGNYYGTKFNFRLKLATIDTRLTPMVESFRWIVDLPDRIENDTYNLATAGDTISYSKPFHVSPSPIITIYNASPGDEILLSSVTTSGFNAQIKNAGSGVARTIHWIAKSY